MLEGGVPIMVDGQCVGAVGVSGVKSSEDAQVARARAFAGAWSAGSASVRDPTEPGTRRTCGAAGVHGELAPL